MAIRKLRFVSRSVSLGSRHLEIINEVMEKENIGFSGAIQTILEERKSLLAMLNAQQATIQMALLAAK